MRPTVLAACLLAAVPALLPADEPRPVCAALDPQKLLDAETFWDNRDWDWYKANIPFFECPDADLTTTYYYRWEVVTKHLTYGSPNDGYAFTEFIDRPFWSGTYGAISCPAGHQLYEVRWLKDPRYARDYARYWFRTPGAQPRRYSCWLADAVWAVHLVHPDKAFTTDLLPDLKKNYEAWERSHFTPEVGLFWQTGHDDGMEININSRQTKDPVRGAPGYRPTLNSYLWADAHAIARIAELAGDPATAKAYRTKADRLKENLQKKLWDPKRQFFFHLAKQDEERDGHIVKALTLTYQTGKYAGRPYGRELIGYVPWQFNLPDAGYEAAWRFLMDPHAFYAPYGPTTVERRDPQFLIAKRCCVWSGQSWPYATTQTLVALANLLNHYDQKYVTKADHPDTGSWEGHDAYNHSEHYFHSGYVDLIITGLVGLRPRADDVLEVNPLAPPDWDYFALDDVPYRGRRVTILWDKTGTRYGPGPGLHILADGQKLKSAPQLGKLTANLPPLAPLPSKGRGERRLVNFAVNNDGRYYPRMTASYSHPQTPLAAVQDGNFWYHVSPPNRWTCEGTPNAEDWCVLDFGTKRRLHTVKLYLLDDGDKITPPARIDLEHWTGAGWAAVPKQTRTPEQPAGRRAHVIRFPELETDKLRVVLTHARGSASGLTEFEAWGDATLPVPAAPPPPGNLAVNATGRGYPKASASHTSRFDRVEMANDGVYSLRPTPHNRWTAYESPNATDWLAIDFGQAKTVGRVVLHLYDDRGGVQPPASYTVQLWDGTAWQDIPGQMKVPATPAGGVNTVTFAPVATAKLRIVFTHRGKSRSGLTEVEVWPK
jgi:hypothetical protein